MTNLPIPIPQGFNIVVKADQKISSGDVIAISEDASSDLSINVAADLEIDPKKVAQTLSKKPGDRIEEGDLIAKKGGILGSKEIHSKVSGTFVKLNEEDGTIVVRTDGALDENSQVNISSPVDGSIVSCDNDKVVLKTDKEAILATEASGENAFGETLVFERGEVEAKDIDDKVAGKIVVAKMFSRDACAKAMGLGTLGLIAEKIGGEYIESLREKKVKIPVLILTSENYKKLAQKKSAGKIIADAKNLVVIKL